MELSPTPSPQDGEPLDRTLSQFSPLVSTLLFWWELPCRIQGRCAVLCKPRRIPKGRAKEKWPVSTFVVFGRERLSLFLPMGEWLDRTLS